MKIIQRPELSKEDVQKFRDTMHRVLKGALTEEEERERNRKLANIKHLVKMIESDGLGNQILNAANNE